MIFEARVEIMPKEGISDPQGQTIEGALPTVGFEGFRAVRVGKLITFTVEAADLTAAKDVIKRACSKFLTNPIIEDYRLEIDQLESAV